MGDGGEREGEEGGRGEEGEGSSVRVCCTCKNGEINFSNTKNVSTSAISHIH